MPRAAFRMLISVSACCAAPCSACGSDANGESIVTELGAPQKGIATYYDANGSGACLFPPSPNDLDVAAVNAPQYASAALCGGCAHVIGPNGSVTVRLVDLCPECEAGHLDLSAQAFAKIANPVDGRVDIEWTLVPCPVSGPVSYFFKDGANQWWTAVQVRNHKLPISSLEYDSGSGFKQIERTDYNFFLDDSGFGPSATRVRVTAVDGQQLIDDLPSVQAELSIQGKAQFR